jgi:hypothetical protein
MESKITLITPPDFFENESYSILFIHLTDEDQVVVSKWLANANLTEHINIYFYDHEIDLPWFLHALARCEYKYIDLDGLNYATSALSGYIVGKKNTYYKTKDENASAVYHYLNQNRITNIESFLERAFNDKIGSAQSPM